MKKINYFLVLCCVACFFGSCATGSYVPSTINSGGVSTNVVLSQANFRILRNVEIVVEVNNSNLRRADVEKSAFAELLRRYPLTGSQAYINVIVEEIRRASYGMGWHPTKLKQHVAVRATIIEFLQENGQPIPSVESPYNTAPQRVVKSESQTKMGSQEDKPLSAAEIQMANKYYIAWLSKTGHLSYDKKLQAELNKLFNMKEINTLKNQYKTNELETRINGYDKKLERFAK